MARYLVGDIQGCFNDLMKLLDLACFDAKKDHLYLAGDLVCRGPDSLSVLRFVRRLKDHGHTVLGNHDLHLLAVFENIKKANPKDKTQPIFDAEDAADLLFWLRHQPLLIEHATPNKTAPGFVMTHAGIPPAWELVTAKRAAIEVENILQSDRYKWLLENMYANTPSQWEGTLSGVERYRYIINAFTRMRFCDKTGGLDMECKQPPEEIKDGSLIPWFEFEPRKKINETLVFGHWAALGGVFKEHLIGLDTGCVWGGSLTMLRWEDEQIFSLPCPVHAR